ncbi:hypothetical protein [Myroides guanonis]|uniref:Uncharacterized protein n=1 Tax=Myroides guanonis TaxID=1150112 RepID=A0A1I3RVT6_9FLAO|nr:hypothetical protein [Myroides guanonis]SFJ50002.1 hypothetical protein SAMN04487893_10918 [Myroides guanonis]
MKNIFKRLQQIDADGLEINTRNIIDESFKLYTKIVVKSGLVLLLVAMVAAIIGSIVISTNFENPEETLKNLITINPLNFAFNELVAYIVVLSAATAIGSILTAGMIQMAADASKDKKIKTSTAFLFFTKKNGFYVFIAHFLISLAFTSISYLLQYSELSLVSLALNWIINSLTALVTPLLIFGNLSITQAFKYSAQVVNKSPLTIIFLLTWNSFLASAGILFFVVGIFFTLPYLFCVHLVLYKQTVGLEEEYEQEKYE